VQQGAAAAVMLSVGSITLLWLVSRAAARRIDWGRVVSRFGK
jgi:hypothetical protein